MKTFLIALISLGLCLRIQAQSTDTIYSYVDTMPEYKGGEGAFMKHILDSLKYPAIQWKEEIVLGMVTLRFVVNKDGSTSDYKVIRSPGSSFSNAVISVIKTMKFKPGIKDGKTVRVYYATNMCFR